jgi:DNA polymerase I-like protein with 3'-5' exonuclease and polymerase domains
MDYGALADAGLAAFRRDCPDLVAVDCETPGVAFFDAPFAATAAWVRPDGEIEAHYFELGDADYSAHVREIMLGSHWVFHNAKFDLSKLLLVGIINRHEVTPDRIEDTEALAHLQDADRIKKLKWLGEALLGIPNTEQEALKKEMKKHKLKLEDGFHLLPREVLIPYAVQDVVLTIKLFHHIYGDVMRWPELAALYRHELELTLVLLDMERRGLALDLEYVDKTFAQLSKDYIAAERGLSQIVGKPIGPDPKAGEFNPDSSPQIKAFFEGLGYSTPFTTKTGNPSYGKEFLKTCDHPIAKALTEYRRVAKLKNTYFLAMKTEQRDGILHPNIRQHGTRTGRMSSGGVEDE